MKKIRLLLIALVALGASAFAVPGTATAGALSDYLENQIIDYLLRGQPFTAPTSVYVALATSEGSDSACGTEVTGGSYARVEVASGLTSWAGTQSSGSTTASSGTSGTTSNNGVIEFPSPTAPWGQVVEFCVFDSDEGGNLLWRAALTTPKTINDGDAAPSFAAGAMTLQIDD